SFFLLLSCSTIRFGTQERIYTDEEDKNEIREFDLSYYYKAMGVPIKGDKSIVESTFMHPDNNTMFICISFPRIGILKTEDNGITFTSQFFKLGFLDDMYGYSIEDDKDRESKTKTDQEKPVRYFNYFAVSPKDPDKIVISMGPYVLLSKDKGLKWKAKNIFFDMENVNIRDVFINDKEEIIVITQNKISISRDWGKKWEKRLLKIQGYPFFKTEYISGYYDNSTDILFASIKHNDEPDDFLSQRSYEYFYLNKNSTLKSGLYYSYDLGKSWKKSLISIPVMLWKYKNKFYGSTIYPLAFYQQRFSDKFKKSEFYKNAKLDNSTTNLKEYIKILINMNLDDYQIISKKNNRFLVFNNIEQEIKIMEENDFANIYNGINKVQSLNAIQWKDSWYEKKKSNNFFYEYNLWRIFKLWTGMQTNDPVLYAKDNNDHYYRIRPHPKFFKTFIRYSIEKQIMLNSKNPFLKKTTDIEFFDPELDPTNGFPVVIEYSNNQGKTWTQLCDTNHVRNIVDPIGNKRSGFYWYKNIDQKKILKLQISFGFDKGVNFFVYPMNLKLINNELLIRLNYFSVAKSYKDLYLIPKNAE
ncbi:MAG: hypothetical protein KAT05_12400, partial [Spirochaetes bacterium]|nr:hypothetical protein [Spirochaetota bacterium]